MTPRNTRTGWVLEQMILPALKRGGYKFETQAMIGERPGGRKHKIDALAWDKDERARLISVKWQQVSGTAEQKVPFEVISLAEAILSSKGKYQKAYLVLGGEGWSLREFYIEGGLSRHLKHADLVSIVSLETFIARANKGEL